MIPLTSPQEIAIITHAAFPTHAESAAPQSTAELTNPEIIVNPVTGDRMTMLHPSHQSQGGYAKIQFELPPGAKGSPLHHHTEMEETFTVLEGCLEMEVGRKGIRHNLKAGESVLVPAGMHHSFCNTSQDWVTFTTENRPAAGFERFIRGLYGLAIDGKVNPEGMPSWWNRVDSNLVCLWSGSVAVYPCESNVAPCSE